MKTQLNDQINLIQHPSIRHLTRAVLDAAPDCFWTMPASTSGKYHPATSLGTGGLIRHTKTVCILTRHLLNLAGIDHAHTHHSICIAAAILHDCCKKSDTERYTAFDHPLRAAELIKTCAATLGTAAPDPPTTSTLAALVASHMGRWNTSPYHPSITLPVPVTPLQRLIHTADYLASRPDITLTSLPT